MSEDTVEELRQLIQQQRKAINYALDVFVDDHVPVDTPAALQADLGDQYCVTCGVELGWPCEPRTALDRLREARGYDD